MKKAALYFTGRSLRLFGFTANARKDSAASINIFAFR